MERQPTGEDRVRMVARQVSEPRTANWIASEADWSHGPTKRALNGSSTTASSTVTTPGPTRRTSLIIVVKHK